MALPATLSTLLCRPESGEGAARSMICAMTDAGISPEQVDYINAHGTSTPPNDKFETMAIKTALGDYAYKVSIGSDQVHDWSSVDESIRAVDQFIDFWH